MLRCPECEARFRPSGPLEEGRPIACPECGCKFRIRRAEGAGEPRRTRGANSSAGAAAAPPVKAKSCPYCGETIRAGAVKCRYCGEFLEEPPARPARKDPRTDKSTREMQPADYVLGLIPGGLVVGIVWAAMKMAKARKMLAVSSLATVIYLAGAVIGYRIWFAGASAWDNTAEMPDPSEIQGLGYGYEGRYGGGYGEEGPAPLRRLPPPSAGDIARMSPEKQRAMRANVHLEHGYGLGSGVVVARRGIKVYILTCRHVVDPEYRESPYQPDREFPFPHVLYVTGDKRPGVVVWTAPAAVDLALVEADAPGGVEPAQLAASEMLAIGDEVFAIGNPGGLGWTYTDGRVSALRTRPYGETEVPIIQTNTDIGPGNSGGGLYNEKGELVGINTFVVIDQTSNRFGFAIRTDTAFYETLGRDMPFKSESP